MSSERIPHKYDSKQNFQTIMISFARVKKFYHKASLNEQTGFLARMNASFVIQFNIPGPFF